MKRLLQRTALILLLLPITYFGGFFLAHWINDVLIAPGVIDWLLDAVHWFRDRLAPSIREPDDIEALYLLGLLLMCWLAVFIVILTLFLFIRRCRNRSKRATTGF
jgi:hypothetical protein